MRPLELRLKGLRSWRNEQTLDFSDLALFAIVGDTGAGKSSLLEAIVYALYNASTFSGRDVRALISDGQQTMHVSLDFEADGKRWRVTRSTSRGSYPPSTHQLVCLSDNEEPPLERESAVTHRIEELIGLDYKGFTSAVLLPQGRFQTLLTATDSERTAILKGIFRLDELVRVRDSADALRRALESPLAELTRRRSALLPDPSATAAEQASALAQVRAAAKQVRSLRDRWESAQQEASARATEAEQAGADAGKLRRQQQAVPALDDAMSAEAELAAEAEPLARERETQHAAHYQARGALAKAADAGEGVDQLSEACPRLDDAAEQLPQLQTAIERIGGELDQHAQREAELAAEAEAIAQARAELDAAAEACTQLESAAELAEGQHQAAATALAAMRRRYEETDGCRAALAEAEETEAAAVRAAGEFDEVEAAAKAQLASAHERFDAARRTESAAAAAVGLAVGDDCPICARELPAGFRAPAAPDVEAAHDALHTAETANQQAAGAAATARAEANIAGQRTHRTRQALGDAEEALRAAEATFAVTVLGKPDLATGDDELLAPLAEAARAARKAVSDAATAAAGSEAALMARDAQLASSRTTQQETAARLAREQAETDLAIGRHRTVLAALPPRFRPAGEAGDELAAARDAASARLAELRTLRDQQEAAVAALAQLDAAERTLAEQREARVLGPRRQAAAAVSALRTLLDNLDPPLTSPEPPAEHAALADHAAWIVKTLSLAETAAGGLETKQRELTEAAKAAEAHVAALLEEADQLDPEHAISDAAGLRDALEDWAGRERTADTLRQQAEGQIEPAQKLDNEIKTVERLRRACDEVARLLADGKFVGWLVGRRQRALLEVASDRFREISGDRYGFAEDFQVVDRRTGQPRSAKTLSGGETFQASLALALGMVELAARGGGRIDSIYLDEGFGSLDPNALDDALSALERRAQSGQLIGVISHVAAVAERLETVLRVSTGSEGSRLERLGASARAQMLEAELAEAQAAA
ncbi:MAG: SMC family ATPase [Actinobacteria bacterium]|nr:MAG: SMC family ATPase [Actinomycetota bacterium]